MPFGDFFTPLLLDLLFLADLKQDDQNVVVAFVVAVGEDLGEGEGGLLGGGNFGHVLHLNDLAVFEENNVEFGTAFSQSLTVEVLFNLPFGYPVDMALLDPPLLFLGLVAEEGGLYFDAGAVHQFEGEEFDEFALLRLELFIGKIYYSDQDLPVLEIHVKVAYFLEIFKCFRRDHLGLVAGGRGQGQLRFDHDRFFIVGVGVGLEEGSSGILIGVTVLTFLTGISFPFLFGLFLYLYHDFFIDFVDLQNLNQFGSIYGGADELLDVE